MSTRVFINYRREDTQRDADALYDFLERKLGRKSVFMDIDSIGPGEDFTRAIQETLASTDVVLMLIGPLWEKEIQKRAANKQPDYVLMEIDQALAKGLKIIPVLFYREKQPDYDGLKHLPEAGRLPELKTVNSLPVHRNYRKAGYEKLAEAIKGKAAKTRKKMGKRLKPVWYITPLIVLLIAFFWITKPWKHTGSNTGVDEQMWRKARRQNNLAYYQMYVAKQKNGRFREQALQIIDRLHESLKIPLLQRIQAGKFQMGQLKPDIGGREESRDEQPVVSVHISGFYMGKYEVTQEQYRATMGANPSQWHTCANCPVETVSWYDAVEYCNRLSIKAGYQPCYVIEGYGTRPDDWPANWKDALHNNIKCNFQANGYRLPTEAEWEFAARAVSHRQGNSKLHYAGSNNINLVAWYAENSSMNLHPVGEKKPNAYDLHDMSGNVWEWCWDWYAPYVRKGRLVADPRGPSGGTDKALRGGSWRNKAAKCRNTARDHFKPNQKFMTRGFRIARSL